MAQLSGMRVVVAGSGAVGSAVALRLQDEGAAVILADPAPLGANASGVAAGMLAPAFEAALDPMATDHFVLLKAARDLWPDLAVRLSAYGGGIDLAGALWVGGEASNTAMLERLSRLGAQADRLSPAEAERLSPGLRAPQGAVWTSEDWTLEPVAMLRAMREAFVASGGSVRPAAVSTWRGGEAELADGECVRAEALVLATGLTAEGMAGPPPELQVLSPVKGQLAQFDAGAPGAGPVVRAEGIYVVPRSRGPVAGATMETGLRDLEIEAAAIDRLKSAAVRLFPTLASSPARGAAGVRASTPDGLPLVGSSRTHGVHLAVGARRNGWLLAPLIAEIVAGQLAGAPGGRCARLFGPGRF